jgi:hypothetical protein
VSVLQAADDWHIPPWRLVEECSEVWWERRRVWREELDAFKNKK